MPGSSTCVLACLPLLRFHVRNNMFSSSRERVRSSGATGKAHDGSGLPSERSSNSRGTDSVANSLLTDGLNLPLSSTSDVSDLSRIGDLGPISQKSGQSKNSCTGAGITPCGRSNDWNHELMANTLVVTTKLRNQTQTATNSTDFDECVPSSRGMYEEGEGLYDSIPEQDLRGSVLTEPERTEHVPYVQDHPLLSSDCTEGNCQYGSSANIDFRSKEVSSSHGERGLLDGQRLVAGVGRQKSCSAPATNDPGSYLSGDTWPSSADDVTDSISLLSQDGSSSKGASSEGLLSGIYGSNQQLQLEAFWSSQRVRQEEQDPSNLGREGKAGQQILKRPRDLAARLASLVEEEPTERRKGGSKTFTVSIPSAASRREYACTPALHSSLYSTLTRPCLDLMASVMSARPAKRSAHEMMMSSSLPAYLAVTPVSNQRKDIPYSWQDLQLKKRLMALAEAVAINDQSQISALQQSVREDARKTGTPMQRVLYFMSLALMYRMEGIGSAKYNQPLKVPLKILMAGQREFEKLIPCMHLTTEASIRTVLEAARGERLLHILDIGTSAGQWERLFTLMSSQLGDPPHLKITSILPQADGSDGGSSAGEMLRTFLGSLALQLGLDLDFHWLATRLETVHPFMLRLEESEPLVVMCTLRLQYLPDGGTLRSNPRNRFLRMLCKMRPRVVVLAEMDAALNQPFFLSRVGAAVDYYFDVLEGAEAHWPDGGELRMLFEEVALFRECMNVLSCEGLQRVVRPESFASLWQRMRSCGFLSRQISAETLAVLQRRLLRFNSNSSLHFVKGGLQSTWHGRPIMGFSAWQPALPS